MKRSTPTKIKIALPYPYREWKWRQLQLISASRIAPKDAGASEDFYDAENDAIWAASVAQCGQLMTDWL